MKIDLNICKFVKLFFRSIFRGILNITYHFFNNFDFRIVFKLQNTLSANSSNLILKGINYKTYPKIHKDYWFQSFNSNGGIWKIYFKRFYWFWHKSKTDNQNPNKKDCNQISPNSSHFVGHSRLLKSWLLYRHIRLSPPTPLPNRRVGAGSLRILWAVTARHIHRAGGPGRYCRARK